MNLARLNQRLIEAGVSAEVYDLTGDHLSERYTVARRGPRWVCYYSERGLETGRREFISESDACKHLLEQISQDQAVQREIDKGCE